MNKKTLNLICGASLLIGTATGGILVSTLRYHAPTSNKDIELTNASKYFELTNASKYFEFTNNGLNDTITGFKPDMDINDIPDNFSLNFKDLGIKYMVAGSAVLSPYYNNETTGDWTQRDNFSQISTFWSKAEEINFDGFNFCDQNFSNKSNHYASGMETFHGVNFENLTSFKLQGSTWAESVTSRDNNTGPMMDYETGLKTFSECSFGKLTTLDLSNVNFGCDNMCNDAKVEEIGSDTFDDSSFPEVTSVNFNNTRFGGNNIDNKSLAGLGSEVHLGEKTFESALFPKLPYLNLNGINFNATTTLDEGDIFTGEQMFYDASFDTLTRITMRDSIFANENMSTGADVVTADKLFDRASMPIYKVMDLGDVSFTSINTGAATLETAVSLFNAETMPELTTIDLSKSIFWIDDGKTTGSAAVSAFNQLTADNCNEVILPNSTTTPSQTFSSDAKWLLTFKSEEVEANGTYKGYDSVPDFMSASKYRDSWNWEV